MNFALALSVILMLGIAGAWWLAQQRAHAAAAQSAQDAMFDHQYRPVAKPSRQPVASSAAAAANVAVEAKPNTAKINPAPNPLRELALTMYEAQGYQRVHAKRKEAPVQFWLREPRDAKPPYALLELESTERVDGAMLGALAQRLGPINVRVLVLSKQGFTHDAKALAKSTQFKLLDNKKLKRKLTELPAQQREQLLSQVKHNLGATVH
jgi:hypothetical protein